MSLRCCCLLLILLTPLAQAETLLGRVIAIADGDTLTILDATNQSHKIRLAGIDSPEKKQDFGQRAKTNLSTLAFGKSASADCRKRDRYQRQICVVSVAGKDVGLAQIRAGLAWWYKQYAREQTAQERMTYEQAEVAARARRLGLWADKDPMPPWDWRHRKRRG